MYYFIIVGKEIEEWLEQTCNSFKYTYKVNVCVNIVNKKDTWYAFALGIEKTLLEIPCNQTKLAFSCLNAFFPHFFH